MGLELLEYFGISIASAVILIVLAKFILQHLIRKAPDYYDKREQAEEAAVIANYGKAGGHGHEEVHEKEKPVEEKPVEVKPADEKPVEKKPVEEKPVEPEPEEEKPVEPEPEEEKPVEPKPEEEKPVEKKTSSDRKPATKKPRKPSMNMKKDELIAAAKDRGIELPEKITKAQILELIEQAEK